MQTEVLEFCTVVNATSKEHIHVDYGDNMLSVSLCGRTPDHFIRKHHLREITSYPSRGKCQNCHRIYENLRRVRFDEKHPVMKILLDRESGKKYLMY